MAAAAAIEAILGQWFPPPAFVRAMPVGDHPILAEEAELVAGAVTGRAREFATGRWLARQGLRHFRRPDRPIGMGRLREPLWPDGILGTLSHDGDLCAAVVAEAHAQAPAGMGIDLMFMPRRNGHMEELAPMFVSTPGERTAAAALAVAAEPAMVLFSLKESAIKALRGRLDDFIDMRALEIRAAPLSGVILDGRMVAGQFRAAVAGDYLVTAMVLA
jgi:4'-phosphopantetheinyl transferase EntD